MSDPIAPQMVGGLLQKVTMTAAPDLMMKGGIGQFEKYAGHADAGTAGRRRRLAADDEAGRDGRRHARGGRVRRVRRRHRHGRRHAAGELDKENLVSFYAAGVGVMFLLFSVSGASGTLLDEVDSGTLDRVLSTRVGMSGLLVGKWLFLTLMGVAQLTVMFLWGRLAFGLISSITCRGSS